MKHTTRKKMLLSSVAMLLVAMVALGSATFAWFTTNPNATASGLQMKATAAKGLVIKTASRAALQGLNANWVHTDYLNSKADGTASDTSKVFELSAASFNTPANDFANFYTVDAKADGNYIADDNAVVSESHDFGNWVNCTTVYKEDINCKLTGTDDATATTDLKMTSLKINLNSVAKKIGEKTYDQANGVRVALLYTGPSGTQSVVGVYNGTGKDVSNKYLTGAGKYSAVISKNVESTTDVDESKYTASKAPTTAQKIGTVDTTGDCKLTVIVYLDGEDSNVFTDSISATQFLNSIEVNLTVAE